MAKLHMLELLCANRHVIAALAYHPDKTPKVEAQKIIISGLKNIGAAPWCFACFSKNLHFECKTTEFESMQEIAPSMIKKAQENAARRALIANQRRAAQNN